MQQKVQVQNFALNLIDYKRQMYLIRDLDTKLRRAASLGNHDKSQLLLGIGGEDERGLQILPQWVKRNRSRRLKKCSRN